MSKKCKQNPEEKEEIKEVEECNCKEECNCEKDCSCDDTCNCSCEEKDSQEEINLLKEELLKAKAETLNYKRRKDEEVTRLLKYAEEDIVNDFLGVMDNFERAIKMDDDNLDDEVSKFLEGVKMIYTHTKNILEKHEVVEINCLGEKFDPMLHQAVLTDKNEEKESGIILEVLQKGYKYKDKVIRHAMVKVNE